MAFESLSDFQRAALGKIRHIGGSIFYASDKRWTDMHGHRVSVPSNDFRTEGFIGWPTVNALMAAEALYLKRGNEYALTSRVPDSKESSR